jgi:hypothetical protein
MSDAANIFADFKQSESRLDSNQDGKGEAVAEDAPRYVLENASPRPLFNGRKPLYELKAESPQHRAIIMMTASGMGNKEIAAALGYSAQHVMYVKKQPWAVEQILKEIENAGREPVLQLFRITAMEACEKQIELMRGADSEKVQSENAEKILDRVFGKANQKIEVTNKPASEFTDDQLAQIAAQGKRN